MKIINSDNIIVSRFKFQPYLMAKHYHCEEFACMTCYTKVPVFYKKLPDCVKKTCPFCGAEFYVYGDAATYLLKRHIPRQLHKKDLEYYIQILIRLLQNTNRIKQATYEITNDYVKVDYDGKCIKVPR